MKWIQCLRRKSSKLLVVTVVLSSAVSMQPTMAAAPVVRDEKIEVEAQAVTEQVEIKEVRSTPKNGGANLYNLSISTKVLGVENATESKIHIRIGNQEDLSDAVEIATTQYDYDAQTGYSVINDFSVNDKDGNGKIYVQLTVDGSTLSAKKEVNLNAPGTKHCDVQVATDKLIYNQAQKQLIVPIHIQEDGWYIVREGGAYWNNIQYRKKGEGSWKEAVFNQKAVDDSYFLELKGVEPGEEYEVWAKIRYTTPNGLRVVDEEVKMVNVPEEVTEGIQGVRLHTPDQAVYNQGSYQLKYDIFPTGTRQGELKWSASAGNYVSISATGLVRVTANPSSPMPIKITLEVDGFKDSTYLTILPTVLDVKIEAPTGYVFEGDEVQLKYSVVPTAAIPNKMTFISAKPEVVSVDGTGKIRVLKNVRDSVGITLDADGKRKTCYVTVKPKIESLTLDQTNLKMEVGQTAKLLAQATPLDQGFDGSEYLKWSSSNEQVASVKKGRGYEGIVTLHQEVVEPVTITLTLTDHQGTVKTATCTINPKEQVRDHRVAGNVNYVKFDIQTGADTFIEDIMKATGITSKAAIRNLTISETDFTELTLPKGLTGLSTLIIKNTGIKTLNLQEDMINVSDLNLEKNKLTTLEIPASMTKLMKLNVMYNGLSSLTLPSELPNLTELALDRNQLTNLHIPAGYTSISKIDASYNQLESLTVASGLVNLTRIEADNNLLTSMMIPSGLTKLDIIYLSDNQLSSIEFPNDLQVLRGIYIGDNQLETLDLPSALSSVRVLSVYENKLKDLNLPQDMTSLLEIQAKGNQLVSLDLTHHLERLTTLGIEHNQFVEPITRTTPISKYKDYYNFFPDTASTNNHKSSQLNVEEQIIQVPEALDVETLRSLIFIEDHERLTSTNTKVVRREETLDTRHALEVVPVDEAGFNEVFEVADGLIKAKKVGIADVKVRIVGTKGNTHTTTENVLSLISGKEGELDFGDKILTLKVGESQALNYQMIEKLKAKGVATWTSTDPQIATVSEKGIVTAHKAGITTVTVQIGDQKAACMINVLGEAGQDILRDTMNQIIEDMGQEKHQEVYDRNELYAYIIDALK